MNLKKTWMLALGLGGISTLLGAKAEAASCHCELYNVYGGWCASYYNNNWTAGESTCYSFEGQTVTSSECGGPAQIRNCGFYSN